MYSSLRSCLLAIWSNVYMHSYLVELCIHFWFIWSKVSTHQDACKRLVLQVHLSFSPMELTGPVSPTWMYTITDSKAGWNIWLPSVIINHHGNGWDLAQWFGSWYLLFSWSIQTFQKRQTAWKGWWSSYLFTHVPHSLVLEKIWLREWALWDNMDGSPYSEIQLFYYATFTGPHPNADCSFMNDISIMLELVTLEL